MRQRVRKMLDSIEDFLMVGDSDAADLAAILTALRGPDDPDISHRKHDATIPIRRAAFPRIARKVDERFERSEFIGSRIDDPDPTPRVGQRRFMSFGTSRTPSALRLINPDYRPPNSHHFEEHINVAAEALEAKDEYPTRKPDHYPYDWTW